MTSLKYGKHLTLTGEEIHQTHAGMAHFAGSGPDDKTCRECEHWGHQNPPSRTSSKTLMGGELNDAICIKAKSMMGLKTPRVPHDARACKYFTQDVNPPDVFKKT